MCTRICKCARDDGVCVSSLTMTVLATEGGSIRRGCFVGKSRMVNFLRVLFWMRRSMHFA